MYATEAPPPDYSLELEVAGITRVADDAGFDQFHLVGYSGGGASSLAFAASRPERLLSLALMEPAFAGWQEMTAPERSHLERFRALLDMDGPEMLAMFQALQLAPGVDPPAPPPGPAPPWMAKRPAALHAILRAFFASDLDLETLRRFDRPVWFALGGRSNPDYYGRMAERLAGVFPDFTIESFPTGITSIHRTGSSRLGWRHRCDRCGPAPSPVARAGSTRVVLARGAKSVRRPRRRRQVRTRSARQGSRRSTIRNRSRTTSVSSVKVKPGSPRPFRSHRCSHSSRPRDRPGTRRHRHTPHPHRSHAGRRRRPIARCGR